MISLQLGENKICFSPNRWNLAALAEPIFSPKAVMSIQAALINVEELMTFWETTVPHRTSEERGGKWQGPC
jgi:hypothetical protein